MSIWSAPAEGSGGGAVAHRPRGRVAPHSKAPSPLRSAGALHKSQRRDQSRQQGAAQRNVVGEDMLMRRVCTIALNTQAIEHGHAHRAYKISVGSSADTCFTQIEIEHSSDGTRPLVKSFNFVSSFERRSIDFSADDQLGALVEWFQVENLVLQPTTKFRGTETQIDLSAGFSRHDVRMCTPVKGADGDGCSLLQIVHRMQSHRLPRQFQHGADAFFRIETRVSR